MNIQTSLNAVPIEIDINACKVCLLGPRGKKYLRGKGYYFFCLLIANEENKYLSGALVHHLPLWNSMQMASVGKQVARILSNLEAEGLDLIEWRNKTDGWRLRPEITSCISEGQREAAREQLQKRTETLSNNPCKADYKEVANWFINVTKATASLTLGRISEAHELITKVYETTKDNHLCALSDPLFVRIGQSIEKPLRSIPYDLDNNFNLFELAIEARVISHQVIRANSDEWQDRYNELERLHRKLKGNSDFTSQARVTLGLAILSKRLGRPEDALSFIMECATLAFFSGDIIMMQSVAFNFGNILYENQRNIDNTIEESAFINLLNLDIEMRKEIGFGQIRAQSDLVLAYYYLKQNKFDIALKHIDEAEYVIKKSNNVFDEALWYNVKGLALLSIAKRDGTSFDEGNRAIDHALEIYDKCNNALGRSSLLKERKEILSDIEQKA